MSIITLPPDRRAELDGALQRVTQTLAHDAPLFAQIDCFREHLDFEPSLAEWCIWFAEVEDCPKALASWHVLADAEQQIVLQRASGRLRLLWSYWLEQTEPEKSVQALWYSECSVLRWHAVREIRALGVYQGWEAGTRIYAEVGSAVPVGQHLGVDQEGRVVPIDDPSGEQETVGVAIEPATAKGQIIQMMVLGQGVVVASKSRILAQRELKRRVLSLFPEVIVWEQEFTKLIPLIGMDTDAVAGWHQMTRADVEAQGWGKHKEQGSDLWISYDDLARCVYYTERLYANQLILGEGGKPIAPPGVRRMPHPELERAQKSCLA